MLPRLGCGGTEASDRRVRLAHCTDEMPVRIKAGTAGADGAPQVLKVGEASRKAFLKGEGGGVEPQDGTIFYTLAKKNQ